jgi:hypothetical protein
VLKGADFMGVFDPSQIEAISMLFMEAHGYGYLIAGGFFGLHMLLLGIQVIKSDTIPSIFGWFLIGSAAGYLLETFGNFMIPGHEATTALIVGTTAALGEVSFTLYLLIKGRKFPLRKVMTHIKATNHL